MICLALALSSTFYGADIKPTPISTNKDKVLTLAVHGKIAPARPSRPYTTTWNGKPKRAIGIGGINYNLKLGDEIFGWASTDRATVGVAAVGAGESRFAAGWRDYTSIGNEVRVLSGEAKGDKGVVVGKFEGYTLIHFDDDTLAKLSLGDSLHAKARGTGLAIEGFEDVHPHGIAPELLEKFDIQNVDGVLQVPVVKEIPGELAGRGAGAGAISGNWHVQTCYPPDIPKYGLDELRFGDLVVLKDIQTDYGKGFYRGGATVGVVVSGPSDMSGLGIGVTPILSTRFGKIKAKIDPTANLAKYLGIAMKPASKRANGPDTTVPTAPKTNGPNITVLKTNKDKLLTTAVEGVVQPASSRGYSTTYDGKPKQTLGMASINYTVSLGDTAYGWASADHVEPDVTIQGRDRDSPSECALALLACIGNEAEIVSGEAKGAKGIYIGRHAGSDDLVWFPKDIMEKMAINDRVQVKARGVGLQIEGFEDVRVNKLSPELLENMGITIEGGQLSVPIVLEVPGHLMGSGIGYSPIESLDYDIQTTDPATVEKYDLKKLKLGDMVAIRDHYDFYGTGRYVGAITIGVIIHGWSDLAGHGPGVNPLLSAMPGKIKTKIDPNANTAYYLGIKERPSGN
jgi:hypothetical protein